MPSLASCARPLLGGGAPNDRQMTTSTQDGGVHDASSAFPASPGRAPGPGGWRLLPALLLLLLAGGDLLLLTGCQGALLGDEEQDEADVPKDWLGRPMKPAGGAEGPTPPSFSPVILSKREGPGGTDELLERDRERRALPRDQSGFREKWALASRYVESGYDEAASKILDAAIEQGPPEPWRTRLRGLRRSIELKKTEFTMLRAEIRPGRDYVQFGKRIDVVLRIRNVGERTVEFLDPGVGGGAATVSPTAVTLEMTRTDHDIFATQLRRSWSQTFYLRAADGKTIRIPPGGMHEQTARIPPSDVGDPISGYRVVEIGGILRASRVKVGPIERALRVPLRAGRVAVLPGGYQPLAAEPLEGLRRSLETGAPTHLLVATEFVPMDERTDAITVLADALVDGSLSMQRAAIGALQVLHGRSVGDPVAPLAAPLIKAMAERPSRADRLIPGLEALTGYHVAPDARLWQDWWRRADKAGSTVRGDSGAGG